MRCGAVFGVGVADIGSKLDSEVAYVIGATRLKTSITEV